MGRTAMRLARSVPGLAVLVLAAGCTRDPQSTLHAAGDGARRVEGLWWVMFWISMAIFAEVMLLLGWALARRRRARAKVKGGDALPMVTSLGVVVPFVILVLVYGLGLHDLNALA